MNQDPTSVAKYLSELNEHLSLLFSFSRQVNELDFAVSLSGEFRGMQDAGWATTITAGEVFHELSAITRSAGNISKARLRHVLMLYCQLAEAGGVYEGLRNILGVIKLKPYVLWPFQDLVRTRNNPRRIIGPNANSTFRDLATQAKEIGLSRLSTLLETAFRDDIRNGISHADYVIWDDGLRLPRRSGGFAQVLSFTEINAALAQGAGFFQILNAYTQNAALSFDPPKTIVGRLSENFAMPWTVKCDPEHGSLSISGSSPGPQSSPEFERQCRINESLGGKVMAIFSSDSNPDLGAIGEHANAQGFEPHEVILDEGAFSNLLGSIEANELWNRTERASEPSSTLLATPFGFEWIREPADFNRFLKEPLIKIETKGSQTASQ